MSKRYHELQKECKRLGLGPCRGKGITADVLENMIAKFHEQNRGESSDHYQDKEPPMSSFEATFQNLYPHIYSRLPKVRVKEEWKQLLNEMNHLKDSLDYEAFQMLHLDDIYPPNPSLIKKSASRILEYPTLSKYLPYILGHDGFNQIMVTTGNIDHIKEPVYPSLINYLQEEEDAYNLYQRYPNLVRLFPRSVKDAIREGNLSVILWLVVQMKNEEPLPGSIPAVEPNSGYLTLAIHEDQPDILRSLLKVIEPENYLLEEAIVYNSFECFIILLEDERIEPTHDILIRTIQHGNPQLVNALFQYSSLDPSANNNEALNLSIELGFDDIADIIRQHPQFIETREKSTENPFEEIMAMVSPHMDKRQLSLVRKELEKAINSPYNKVLYSLIDGDEETFNSLSNPENFYTEYPNLTKALQRVVPPQPYRLFLKKIVRTNWIEKKPYLNKGIISLLRNRADAATVAGYIPPAAYDFSGDILTKAIRQGQLGEVVWTLFQDTIGGSVIKVNNSHLITAIEKEDPIMVKALLEDSRIDPSSDNNEAIYQAAKSEDPSIVKLLLVDSRVDPAVDDNEPLIKAAELGNIETLNILLADPRTDPSDRDNEAIKMAMTLGEEEVAHILIRDSRVREKLSDEELEAWERVLGLFGP